MSVLLGLFVVALITCFIGVGIFFSTKKGIKKYVGSFGSFLLGCLFLFITIQEVSLSSLGVPARDLSPLESYVVYEQYRISNFVDDAGFTFFIVKKRDGSDHPRFFFLPANFPEVFIKTGINSYKIPVDE